MKHAFFFIQRLFIFASLLAAFGAKAQTPNITAQLVMSPNPSPYLSDWQSRREMAMFSATLTQPMNQPVKLMAHVSLYGQIVARTKQEKMPMLTLQQGQNLFYADRIIPFDAVSFSGNIDGVSQRLGRLPEGSYDICVWFVDAQRGTPIGSSACAKFNIHDVNPPTLITPANGAQLRQGTIAANRTESVSKNEKLTVAVPMTLAELAQKNASGQNNFGPITLTHGNDHFSYGAPILTRSIPRVGQEVVVDFASRLMEEEGIYYRYELENVMISGYSLSSGNERPMESLSLNFSWIAPMPMPNVPVQYKLRIVEVLPGQLAASALQSATPLIEKDNLTSTMELVPKFWALTGSGKSFAWSVQSHDASGRAIGKNGGWAEPRTFEISDLDASKSEIILNSFFDVFGDSIDFVKSQTDSLKKLADSLHATAARLLDKTIDVKKLEKIIKIITDSIKVAVKPDPEPCPFVHKKLLRTVTGPWKKVSTTVRHITVGKRTVAWADVVWTRDVINVFEVSKCTLLKGHAGAHKMGPAAEVKEVYGTFTETVTYGTGVPHAPPSPHPTDALPEE